MSSTGSDSVMDVTVHVDYKEVGNEVALKWYYNNLSADDLQLRVPNNYQRIRFVLDKYSSSIFRLIGKEVKMHQSGDVVYTDLAFLIEGTADADAGVVVHDSHRHCDVAVGSVSLIVEVKDEALVKHPALRDAQPNGTFKSDPEILNTGNET